MPALARRRQDRPHLAAPIGDGQRAHPGSLARLAASPAQVLNARIGPYVLRRSPAWTDLCGRIRPAAMSPGDAAGMYR